MPAESPPTLPFPPPPLRRAAPPPPPAPPPAPGGGAGAEPLYAQVARDLAAQVRRGTLPAGTRLPPEPPLAKAYGVNRLTVREALTSLTRQGLVRRVQGVDAIVADTPVRHRIGGDEASLAGALR